MITLFVEACSHTMSTWIPFNSIVIAMGPLLLVGTIPRGVPYLRRTEFASTHSFDILASKQAFSATLGQICSSSKSKETTNHKIADKSFLTESTLRRAAGGSESSHFIH